MVKSDEEVMESYLSAFAIKYAIFSISHLKKTHCRCHNHQEYHSESRRQQPTDILISYTMSLIQTRRP